MQQYYIPEGKYSVVMEEPEQFLRSEAMTQNEVQKAFGDYEHIDNWKGRKNHEWNAEQRAARKAEERAARLAIQKNV